MGEETLGQCPYPETYYEPGKIPIFSVAGQQISEIIEEMQEECWSNFKGILEEVIKDPAGSQWFHRYVDTVIPILMDLIAHTIRCDHKYGEKHRVSAVALAQFEQCLTVSSVGILQDRN